MKTIYKCPSPCWVEHCPGDDVIPTRDCTEHYDRESDEWIHNDGSEEHPYCPTCGVNLDQERVDD